MLINKKTVLKVGDIVIDDNLKCEIEYYLEWNNLKISDFVEGCMAHVLKQDRKFRKEMNKIWKAKKQ